MSPKRFTVELERVQKTARMLRVRCDRKDHRREYVERVEEARRPKTRSRRIGAMVARVLEGEPQRR